MPFKKRPPKDPAAPAVETVSKVASIDDVTPDDAKRMLAEIAELRSQLAVEKEKRGEAEQAALEAAQAQGALLQSEVREVPTGKTVEVQRVKGYKTVGHRDDGRPIKQPIFETVLRPTFFYKIDMPPCGGTHIGINGVAFYHGAVYEFDEDTLRTVKEMVYRTWDHDRSIHGSDENFYRGKQQTRLSARGMV